MNLIEMMERFPTQEACIEFLEGIGIRTAHIAHYAEVWTLQGSVRRNTLDVGIAMIASPVSRQFGEQCFTGQQFRFRNGFWELC